jgi:predicted glycosyltransferase
MRLRILIAVTHLLGVGHLTRAVALARTFARAGHETTLVSGGMPAPLVRSDGLRFVQLPPLRTMGTNFTTLLDESGQPVTPSRLEGRREMLTGLIEELRPDVVLTELFPFGRRALAGEFMALVQHAKAMRPETLVLSSIRDILVAPAKPERVAGSHQILRAFYDAVLVHGDPDLVPIDASWPVNPELRALLRYTGYVDEGTATAGPPPNVEDEIIVSGGGSAASLPLYRAAVAAAALVTGKSWRILVGMGVAETDFAHLRQAAPSHVILERARPDFRELLAGAALSVSQAGYNTVIDVLRTGVRAVFVPFEQGNESEQRLRAERLAALGLADIISEADLSPGVLADRVRIGLRRPPPRPPTIGLDGAERSVAMVEELGHQRFGPARSPAPLVSGWAVLEEALNRAADKGVKIPFWWRDDDATAHTPQLQRLITLARRLDIPVAIAAVPAHIEPSLPVRLAGEPLVRVLVHGLSHANHARLDKKKAEFGAHRPLPRLSEDAAEGLRLAQNRFGELLVPVFIPPWNRVAPELVHQLPKLGFRGLSAFGERRTREPALGLVQVNTHIDPIAWHDGRSLADREFLLERLAQAIMGRAMNEADASEPIGLLTHHLVQDEPVWHFCEELLARMTDSTTMHFPDLDGMFAGAQTAAT